MGNNHGVKLSRLKKGMSHQDIEDQSRLIISRAGEAASTEPEASGHIQNAAISLQEIPYQCSYKSTTNYVCKKLFI